MKLISPQLEAFWLIQQTGSVHEASRKLGLSQTAVTQRLKSLEEQLKVSLFMRSRQGMKITNDGEALKRYCENVMALEGETLAQIGNSNVQTAVTIGFTGPSSLLRFRLLPGIVPILTQYPFITPRLQFTETRDWIDRLRSGSAHLALLPTQYLIPDLASKRLKPEQFVLLGPKSWSHRSIRDIIQNEKRIQFGCEDLFLEQYLNKYDLKERFNSDPMIANNNEAIAELVQNELGYALISKEMAQKFLERCRVCLLNQGRTIEQEIALAWYPRPQHSDYWKAIIKAIK